MVEVDIEYTATSCDQRYTAVKEKCIITLDKYSQYSRDWVSLILIATVVNVFTSTSTDT